MRDALREALTTALAVVLHEHRDPGCTGEPDYEDTQTEALYLIEDIYRQPNVRAALAARSEPDCALRIQLADGTWTRGCDAARSEPMTYDEIRDAALANAARLRRSEPGALTRATAKGTAIDVDEWGRPLYVVAGEIARSEPGAEGLREDAGYLADAAKHLTDHLAMEHPEFQCEDLDNVVHFSRRVLAALAETEPEGVLARVLPDDTVCACLDETGGRKVRRYEQCQRCGAFMVADDDPEGAVLVTPHALAVELRAWEFRRNGPIDNDEPVNGWEAWDAEAAAILRHLRETL